MAILSFGWCGLPLHFVSSFCVYGDLHKTLSPSINHPLFIFFLSTMSLFTPSPSSHLSSHTSLHTRHTSSHLTSSSHLPLLTPSSHPPPTLHPHTLLTPPSSHPPPSYTLITHPSSRPPPYTVTSLLTPRLHLTQYHVQSLLYGPAWQWMGGAQVQVMGGALQCATS